MILAKGIVYAKMSISLMTMYGTVHRKPYDNYVCRLNTFADLSRFILENFRLTPSGYLLNGNG